jgi:myo-inositol 2-dehydrogenase/D-chiro-inositol 1-dehydrogenase
MTINIALLGVGRIGRVHAKAIAAERSAALVVVADTDQAAAHDVADAYGGKVLTIDQIVASREVDAVVLCTPTDTHADLIERFAHAGKAIFCEKPIDLDINRVRQCLSVVEETNTAFMLGFNRRFDPHFAALKQTISNGRIGSIEQITLTSRDPGLPPAEYIARSGGIFRDMTIHDFDMARFLLDEPVTKVFATAGALVDPSVRGLDDFDTATIVLETESGKQVVILNSRRATYGYDQRIEVHGSLGMVQAENHRPIGIEIATALGYTRPPLHDFFMTRYLDAYAAEIAAFVGALKAGTKMPTTGQDGLAALELAEAALKSVATGAVVFVGSCAPSAAKIA